jgi:hypothetical protein
MDKSTLPPAGTYRWDHGLFPEEIDLSIESHRRRVEADPSASLPPGGPAGVIAKQLGETRHIGTSSATESLLSFAVEAPTASGSTSTGTIKVGYDDTGPSLHRTPHNQYPYVGLEPSGSSYTTTIEGMYGYSFSTPLKLKLEIDTGTSPHTFIAELQNRSASKSRQGVTFDSHRAGFTDAMSFVFDNEGVAVQMSVNDAGDTITDARVLAITGESGVELTGSGTSRTLVFSFNDTHANRYEYDSNGSILEGQLNSHTLTDILAVASESAMPNIDGEFSLGAGISLPIPAYENLPDDIWSTSVTKTTISV